MHVSRVLSHIVACCKDSRRVSTVMTRLEYIIHVQMLDCADLS